MAIRANDLLPGVKVSVNQCQSSLLGHLFPTKGKEDDSQWFQGGTIMVDHASGHVFVHHQVSLNMGETLKGIKKFEQLADSNGIKIKSYHADNQPFDDKTFRKHCNANGQDLDFSGVGTHHQNAVAEQTIKTVTWLAQTMMLHAIIVWPDQVGLRFKSCSFHVESHASSYPSSCTC